MVNKTEKKTKTISLLEFQAWLEGIEECQPKGWAPDSKQWKVIRNKFKTVDATVVLSSSQEQTGYADTPKQKMAQPNTTAKPQTPRQPTRSPMIPPAPPSPGGIPDELLPASGGSGTMTPAAQAALNGRLPTGGSVAQVQPGSAIAPPSFV